MVRSSHIYSNTPPGLTLRSTAAVLDRELMDEVADVAVAEATVRRSGRLAIVIAAAGLAVIGAAFLSPGTSVAKSNAVALAPAAEEPAAVEPAQPLQVAAVVAPVAPQAMTQAEGKATATAQTGLPPLVTPTTKRAPVPPKLKGLLQKGTKLVEQGQYAAALPYFQAAVKVAPRNADAWYGIAISRAERNDFRLARKAAQKSVAAQPRHGNALVLLGFLEQLALDVPNAKAHYELYLATNPGGEWASELSAVLKTIDAPLPTARNLTKR
ncbi:MAG: tetratricopeptide repeat protein [Myxococcaceae bacterium]|nr:tetratricopeptide repeat protein [Myxococcaceae bacterium]